MHFLHHFSNKSYRNKILLSHFLFFIALDEDLWIYLLFDFFNKLINKIMILYNVQNYFFYINSCRNSISVFFLHHLDDFIINNHLYAYTYIYFMIKNLCLSYLSLFFSLCLYLFGNINYKLLSMYNLYFFSSYKLPTISHFEEKFLFYSNYRTLFISNNQINDLNDYSFFLSRLNWLIRNKKIIEIKKIKDIKWIVKKKYFLWDDFLLRSLLLNMYQQYAFIIEKRISLNTWDTFLNFIIIEDIHLKLNSFFYINNTFSFFLFFCEKKWHMWFEKSNFHFINQFNDINIFNSLIFFFLKKKKISNSIVLTLLHFFYYELIKFKTSLLSSSLLKTNNSTSYYDKYMSLVLNCAYHINIDNKII